jgi:hypothetical protein
LVCPTSTPDGLHFGIHNGSETCTGFKKCCCRRTQPTFNLTAAAAAADAAAADATATVDATGTADATATAEVSPGHSAEKHVKK